MTEPTAATTRTSLLDQIGVRALRRAEPRASIAVAAAGCALAVLGVLIISGDTGSSDDGLNRWPGVVLSAAVVAAGFFVLSQVQRGAVATGGAVAAALGVPPLLFFLTWDDGGFPPYSTEAILAVSTLAWLGSYLVGPGRGRPFFLGAGLIGLWLTVLQVTEKVFDLPFLLIEAFTIQFEPSFDDQGFASGSPSGMADTPDPTTLGMLTLVLGVAYLVIGRILDGSGRHGAATPFAMATLPLLGTAPLFLADDLEVAGTGLLISVIGIALAITGAANGRRTTTWLGGAAVAIGVATFLTEMTDDATAGGMLFLAAGIALVFAGHAYAAARDEPDEMAFTGAAMAGTGILSHLDHAKPLATATAPDEPGADPIPPTPGPAPTAEAPEPAPSADDHTQWAPPTDEERPPPPF